MDTKKAVDKMLGKEEQKDNDVRVKKMLGTNTVGKVSAEKVMNKILGKEGIEDVTEDMLEDDDDEKD